MLLSHTSYIPIHEVGVTNFVAQDLFVFLNHLNPIMWWMRGKANSFTTWPPPGAPTKRTPTTPIATQKKPPMVTTKNSHVFKKKQESKLLGILISYIYIYNICILYTIPALNSPTSNLPTSPNPLRLLPWTEKVSKSMVVLTLVDRVDKPITQPLAKLGFFPVGFGWVKKKGCCRDLRW